ncbi:hypothetical protein Dred_0979 [Desulforamulus reducens MI-1]|uniref:Uncharacterized protein n=1 Tax=Desulforamulus reducens (strain ATCC BAA-1160 / DSM 100696 / MI-1) TaxID=349161 RepID=A4J361_DESRM|nr:hypothetical protein [Desulforamulus reducens]ABO49514.1 hypothetical protein Dred_0979 [Desulforamulus reducens MI-1]
MLRKKYETAYLLKKIIRVTGIRYNIRPDLDDPKEAEAAGLYTKETTAGFFRTYILTPVHLGLVKFVNEYGFLSKKQLISLGEKYTWLGTDLNYIIYQCVAYGLMYRNQILFDNHSTIDIFGLDTGGYFALEEAGTKQNKQLYTLGIDQRLNIYRKSVYLLRENNPQLKSVSMLEDIVNEKDFRLHSGKIVLFDSKISQVLNLGYEVDELVNQLDKAGAKVIDISKDSGFVLDPPLPEKNPNPAI